MLKGEKGFTNFKGDYFNDITHIKYKNIDFKDAQLAGKSYFNSSDPIQDFEFRLENGVHIYASKKDPSVAYRIYDDYADAWYSHHYDDILIQKLQELQPFIKLTEFPYGVVTRDDFLFQIYGPKADYVIGQIIPYYKDFKDISKFFKYDKLNQMPTYYYLKIIEILLEQEKYGIFYQDIHGANFIVNPNTDEVKNIDFAPGRIFFDKSAYSYNQILNGIKRLIQTLNNLLKFDMEDSYNKVETLEELYEFIQGYDLKVKNDDKVKRLLLK